MAQLVASPPHRVASASPFGVLVVDPSEIVGWGLRALLARQPWITRCLHAADLDSSGELLERYEPRVLLMSTTFPGFAAGEGVLALRDRDPDLRAIILAAQNDTTRCWGHPVDAWGWMEREWPADRVLELIEAVGRGERRLPSKAAPPLSPRQSAVLGLIAAGRTNREIAETLELSPNTVKEYVGVIFRRLDARNRAEAVRRAQRWGMVG